MVKDPRTPSSSVPATLRYLQAGSRLPEPIAPFVGREREIQSVRALLATPGMRLLTLVGPGGVGKTRLALQAVSGMTEPLHRATYLVPLAAVSSVVELGTEIVKALEASDGGAASLIDTIRAALRGRLALAILDNMEHLLPEAAHFVGELLDACPSLNLLVTSRSPLRVYGEQQFSVPPLSLDTPGVQTEGGAGVDDCEAARLFLIRSQAVDPVFQPSASDRKDIAEICRRLDGLPLAIELAAAHVAELPPRAYLQRLIRNLPLPDGGIRNMPQRQQTLSAVVGWSYALLDQDQQAMFRRMSVLSGGFDLDAAAAMAEDLVAVPPGRGVPHRTALDLMLHLVDASLVHRLRDPSGDARYHMLETIRAYSLERANDAGEIDVLHARHARYYLNRVSDLDQKLLAGHVLAPTLDYLDSLLPNIRSAMEWCAQQNPQQLARFTRHLMQYWLRRSRIQEGVSWLLRLQASMSALPKTEQSWVQANLGRLLQYSRPQDAETYLQAAFESALTDEDHEVLVAVQISRVLHAVHHDRPAVARAAFDVAMQIPDVESVSARVTQPAFLHTLDALVTGACGDLVAAGALAQRLLARTHAEGDEVTPALLHRILCAVERTQGNLEPARGHVIAALGIYEAMGEEWNVANCLLDLAILMSQNYPELSVRLIGAADQLLIVNGAGRIDPARGPLKSLFHALSSKVEKEAMQNLLRDGGAEPWRTMVQEARVLPVNREPRPRVARRAPSVKGVLSPREREVLRFVAMGLTDREIAATLGLSYRTVTSYVSGILTKFDVPSRAAAVRYAGSNGYLDD